MQNKPDQKIVAISEGSGRLSPMVFQAHSIPPPPPMDVCPGQRFSLCGEALAAVLAQIADQAQAAGWHEREVAVATMTWSVTRAAMIDGGDAVVEALLRSIGAAQGQGG